MNKIRDRAYRRHQTYKHREKTKNYLDIKSLKGYYNDEEIEKAVAWRAKTKKPCSCPACGNPRKHFKELTLQEKKMRELYYEIVRS